MKNILKVSKYQVYDFRNAVGIFYFIIFLILSIAVLSFNNLGGNVTFGGFGMATVIFIFIAGLNSFKSSFKFMLANNVSRRRFYYGNIIALLIVAAFMALIDSILSLFLNSVIPYESLFLQIYNQNNIFVEFLWSFGLYGLLVFLGWLITMLYYRCNTIMKTVISVSPIVIVILIQYISSQLEIPVGQKLIDLIGSLLGFASNNPNVAILSFSIISIVVLALSFLLIRKAPIKE